MAKVSQRCGIDAIALYQVHWPNRFVPISSTMFGMKELLKAGKIRAIGVSNFSLARWQRAEAALGAPVISKPGPVQPARPKVAGRAGAYAEK